MLKTNTKKAAANLQQYIIDNFNGSNYTDTPPEDWHGIAGFILETFRIEKYNCAADHRYYNNSEQAAFVDWCAGLPSILDTCYFYNRSAVDDLGAILEETETEKSKHSETDAEQCLTRLIYKVLKAEELKK